MIPAWPFKCTSAGVTSELVLAGVDAASLEHYLKSLLGKDLELLAWTPLDGPDAGALGKSYGYGTPVRIDYRLADGARRSAVLHTMSPGPFGHEHMADRAHSLLWSHHAFNRLPRHVQSFDVGGFQPGGNLLSLGQVEEFCLLTEFAEGSPYALDLERIRGGRRLTDLDFARADALCDYLVDIHSLRAGNSGLYVRRIRELVGDGECIMGLADSYPPHPWFTPQVLQQIEQLAVSWRWKLKNRTHRLRQVHGDFHPWNILFGPDVDFRLLDRSRGEFGDPADDVACLTLNYVFFSLQGSGRLEGGFEALFLRFWERYLEKTGDREILQVAAPFFVFRALVMASPLWYPSLEESVRRKLLAFLLAVLETDVFDPTQVNAYCAA